MITTPCQTGETVKTELPLERGRLNVQDKQQDEHVPHVGEI
jgi:hypothetical protein